MDEPHPRERFVLFGCVKIGRWSGIDGLSVVPLLKVFRRIGDVVSVVEFDGKMTFCCGWQNQTGVMDRPVVR